MPSILHVLLLTINGLTESLRLLEMSDKCLQRKIDLCNELLEIAALLEPGHSRFRGNLLYDLQAAMVVQAKRDYEHEKITKEAAKVIKYLKVEKFCLIIIR